MQELLAPGGTLAGLLFNKNFEAPGPPYGGSLPEYQALFEKKFYIKNLSSCTNSAKPRAGSELFLILKKAGATVN